MLTIYLVGVALSSVFLMRTYWKEDFGPKDYLIFASFALLSWLFLIGAGSALLFNNRDSDN